MSTVTLHTNHGDITIELNHEKTPNTAANFLSYAKDGFYDGTIFHRVIKGFMIQGGGFAAGMAEKNTNAPIDNEANTGLPNNKGTIAMARTQDPHSATAQFFINAADNAFLNHQSETMQGWGYCAFGQVTSGMDVVEAIEKVSTGSYGFHQDVPNDEVVIESVTINE